jgi:hypothetical protein
VPAVLFFEEAGRTRESFCALRVLAEVFNRFGGMLWATDLVIQLELFLLRNHGLLHQLLFGFIIINLGLIKIILFHWKNEDFTQLLSLIRNLL